MTSGRLYAGKAQAFHNRPREMIAQARARPSHVRPGGIPLRSVRFRALSKVSGADSQTTAVQTSTKGASNARRRSLRRQCLRSRDQMLEVVDCMPLADRTVGQARIRVPACARAAVTAKADIRPGPFAPPECGQCGTAPTWLRFEQTGPLAHKAG